MPPLTIAQGGRTALLRHEMPGGEGHLDWLVESVGPDEGAGANPDQRSLAAFRLAARLDCLVPGQALEATRISDHRRLYLDYEGLLSENRGSVKRLASGRLEMVQRSDEGEFTLRLRWLASPLEGRHKQWLRLAPTEDPTRGPRASQPRQYVLRCAAGHGAAQ